MRNVVLAALGSAALGLFAGGTASATPLAAPAFSHEAAAPLVQDVAWRTVCRKRTVWRQNRYGKRTRVTVRDCDRVWAGPRYYHNGRYYGDRGFTIRIN
ncbi:MAG: hypothetical protein K0R27_2565 [Xanthobacteraceae bacterium]|jgi:hypothetical protein|nr:hypothetical protein [Xanthobacteraceae bacterium]